MVELLPFAIHHVAVYSKESGMFIGYATDEPNKYSVQPKLMFTTFAGARTQAKLAERPDLRIEVITMVGCARHYPA